MSILGIDLGTSGIRVAAFEASGSELAFVTGHVPLTRPGRGRVEIDADNCVDTVLELLSKLTKTDELAADPAETLSFSVLGEAVLPVDSRGRASAPAPISMDTRGRAPADLMTREVGPDDVHRVSGQPLHHMFSIFKIAGSESAWANREIRGYRCMGDYVASRLGGAPVMDTTMAARTGGFDVGKGEWSEALLDALGIPLRLLPEVVLPGTQIGRLDGEVARATGLRVGLPIIVGSHDQACSFWGAGGRPSERAVFSFGSSDCLTVGSADRPSALGRTGIASYPVSGDSWLTLAGTAAGGWALDWLCQVLNISGAEQRDLLFSDLAETPPELLVLPYFSGSGTLDNDPRARGAIVGLTLEATRQELARAFVEASAFELRKIIDVLTKVGVTVGDVLAVGGGASNRNALSVRASAADVPLIPVPGHASARGAALHAGVGIGLYPSMSATPLPDELPAGQPSPETRAWYASQSSRYRSLYPALTAIDLSYSAEETA